MIDPQTRLQPSSPKKRVRRPARAGSSRSAVAARRARRCRKLVGKEFSGPHSPAAARMVRACLGPKHHLQLARFSQERLHRAPPHAGELVLFHNTRDENANGRLDDRFTDAGVVVSTRGERVEFIFLRQGQVRLGVLNLGQPNRRRLRSATVQNTYLRVISPNDPPQTRYLAGQLLAGFTKPPAAER